MSPIIFPSNISSDHKGYLFFARLSQEIASLRSQKIVFDFRNVSWFEANLCAILGAIISQADENLNTTEIINLKPTVADILERNDFLTYYTGMKRADGKATVVAFKKFKMSDESAFRNYLEHDLLAVPDLPKMSSMARKKILESIFELFNNAVIHARCKHIFSCGQYFPNKKELKFTVVDLGKTIRSNVSEFLRQPVEGDSAIDWAVEEGTTTKTGPIPGGLGLSIIRAFLDMNGGDIQIVSDNGYWKEKNKSIEKRRFLMRFPGTIVNLEFNMNDLNRYVDKSELQDTPLF
jgi:anti-anti-sigma regulatory factor